MVNKIIQLNTTCNISQGKDKGCDREELEGGTGHEGHQ